jgi:hypothetical protein
MLWHNRRSVKEKKASISRQKLVKLSLEKYILER